MVKNCCRRAVCVIGPELLSLQDVRRPQCQILSAMNYPLFLARRLSLTSGGRKRTPATAVATAAVALSVAVMLASIAVVTGFKRQITDKVVGFNSHITLSVAPDDSSDGNLVTMTPGLASILDSKPYVAAYSLQASMPAILKTPGDFKGVYMRGINDPAVREFMKNNLVAGSLPDTTSSADPGVLLSDIAVRQLGLKAGEKIDVYFMSDDIRVRRLPVTGVYNSHFDSYDNLYAYAPMSLIRELGGLRDDQGVSLLVTTGDFSNVEQYSADLQNSLMQGLADGTIYRLFQVDNAMHQGGNFFRWLSLLDMNVIVVLTLMTVVACVTLVSGMLIIILDKKRFIGLMKALGTPTRKLRKVFIYLAVRVALTGMLIGNVLMLALLFLQKLYHFIPLDADAYYIDFVPVEISWPAVVLLNIGVVVVVYLSLVLPSRFVGKISPAELIRGEE